jgi:hypothetical protein
MFSSQHSAGGAAGSAIGEPAVKSGPTTVNPDAGFQRVGLSTNTTSACLTAATPKNPPSQ